MQIIDQSFEIVDELDGQAISKKIEKCARICYKSEDKITEGSAEKFIGGIIKRGHESVLEHEAFTVKFVTDRSVTHELVRHRLASFSQESQRYVKYDNVEFIKPIGVEGEAFEIWKQAMENSANEYKKLIDMGLAPQFARTVLPNSCKTEIMVSANLREWRHILKLRTSKAAHPQIRELMTGLLKELQSKVPVMFDDIVIE